jgi:hypothetical protein
MARFARVLVLLFAFLILSYNGSAQTTELTYQGQLQSSSAAANGTFDFEFVLFDAGGTQIGPVVPRSGVPVANGIFSVNLDFGSSFPGATRFLEIRVRQSGGGAFTTLAPRQPVTSAPYSVKSLNSENAVNAANAATAANALSLGGVAANQYLQTNGSGSGLTNLSASSVTTGTLNNARLGQISTANIADSAVTGAKIAGGQVVKSLNGLTHNVTLTPGANILFAPGPNGFSISSTAAGVSGSGTTNTVPLWTGGTMLGNSLITQSSGRIGIGTTSPTTALLNVNGGNGPAIFGVSNQGIGVIGRSTGGGSAVVGDSSIGSGVDGRTVSGIGVQGTAIQGGGIALSTQGSSWFKGDTTPLSPSVTGTGTGIVIGSAGTIGYISAFDYSAFQARTLLLNNSGGNVGINTNTPDQALTVNGNASKPGGGMWLTFSDERLKNIKGRFSGGLKAVMKLQPLRYEYKPDNVVGIKSEGEHIGFSAQEVEKIIPEAVTKTENGYRLVNNDPIIWAMLNGMKEQQSMIEQLRSEIRQLRRVVARKKSDRRR